MSNDAAHVASTPESQHYIDSAVLAALRDLVATMDRLSTVFDNAVQLRFVLDTNVILGDLIWLSRRRVKPGAKTSIQELIAAKTLIPYAPSVARQEVEEALPEIAGKFSIDLAVLVAAWTDYQKALTFCEVTVAIDGSSAKIRDPDDLPFIQLSQEIGAAGIVTKDKDIAAMGGNEIHIDCILQLRDYSRAKSVELTIQVGGVAVAMIGAGLVIGTVRLLQGLIRTIVRLPPWVQVFLFCATVAGLAHPKSREAIFGAIARMRDQLKDAGLFLRDPAIRALNALQEAQSKVGASLASVEKRIRLDKRIPLRTHVYAICAEADAPISVVDIERKLKLAGYKSKSKSARSYLLKVLRQDNRLYALDTGHWALVPMTDLANDA